MDANGEPLTEREAMSIIRQWLPLLSDKARGELRALLFETRMIRREYVTPFVKQADEVKR